MSLVEKQQVGGVHPSKGMNYEDNSQLSVLLWVPENFPE